MTIYVVQLEDDSFVTDKTGTLLAYSLSRQTMAEIAAQMTRTSGLRSAVRETTIDAIGADSLVCVDTMN